MMPPECDFEQVPLFWYMISGGGLNLLVGIVAFLLGMAAGGLAQHILNIFALVAVGIGLTNLFPAKLGGMPNDGYQLFIELKGNSDMKKYIYCLLLSNGIFANANSTKELPEKIRDIILGLEMTDLGNSLRTNLLFYKMAIFQEEEKYEYVREGLQKIWKDSRILPIFKNEAACDLLYYEIMEECREEEITKLYDKKLQKYIKATALYPSRKRLMYAYYLIYKKDEKRAEQEYDKLLETVKTHPIKVDGVLELKEAQRIKSHYEERTHEADHAMLY